MSLENRCVVVYTQLRERLTPSCSSRRYARPTFMLLTKKSTSAFVYGATFSFGRQLCADGITIPIEKKKDGK